MLLPHGENCAHTQLRPGAELWHQPGFIHLRGMSQGLGEAGGGQRPSLQRKLLKIQAVQG